ncbi:MAG: hypothetical protein JXI43_05120 [Tissierellales bacterium]|nr:hypothetical protein [Tissierellales bacterium]
MPVTYKNRKGDIYYLKRKESKAGKARYHFSKKVEGDLPTKIPDGFEIYENPNAQVFLRRKLYSNIKSEEIDFCKSRFPEICTFSDKAVIIDHKINEIIIHYSEQLADIFPSQAKLQLYKKDIKELSEVLFRNAIYHPMLKFTLIDEEKRLFITERYCFLGGIDDWIEIGTIDKLPKLVDTYGKHLGKESFFDLV